MIFDKMPAGIYILYLTNGNSELVSHDLRRQYGTHLQHFEIIPSGRTLYLRFDEVAEAQLILPFAEDAIYEPIQTFK